jgi:serine/threonine-protein kinase
MAEHVTLLRPGPPGPGARGTPSAIPADLLGQAAARLRAVALVYAVTFFMAGVFPMLLVPADRAMLFGEVVHWAPSFGGILLALLVALAAGSRRIPLPVVMGIGLAFEVAGSYGIAAAEVAGISGSEIDARVFGLSWVAPWVMLFTIVVPTRPRTALAAAVASVSAVPVIVGLLMATGAIEFQPAPVQFFFWLVLPYLLVVGMAYVGARVVYRLGTEVGRARALGSYELEEKLGEGGMGEVWRARHRMLARPAAIKLIRPSLMTGARPGASEGAIRRFEREAQVIAQLRSPHTVDLFDFGVADDGTFYYVMELLDGLDADTLVRRHGPVPVGRAVHILRQVCHSLSEAEARGLVHRDVKPANIFLCRYGEECDFVKVLDFGIVAAARDKDAPGPALSGENAVQGTPAFMAPEQALGAPVDGRTDLYAAGCVAYWLLTGELVFTGDNPMGLLVDHARTPPEPPSSRTDRPIPPALDALVLSCLAKDPARRPQSARELARRLAEVEGADSWTPERARAWWEASHPAGAGANSSTSAVPPGPPSPRPMP